MMASLRSINWKEVPNLKWVILLIVCSLIAIMLLMGSLFWTELRVFTQLTGVPVTVLNIVFKDLYFFSWVTGISVALVSFLIVLYSIRTINSLGKPLTQYRTALEIASDHEDEELEAGLKQWMYNQLKLRILSLVMGGISIIILLMTSLYLATLQILMTEGLIDKNLQTVLAAVLSEYSWIIAVAVALTALLFSFLSLKLARKISGYTGETTEVPALLENKLKYDFPVTFDELERRLDQVMLSMELETKGKKNE